MFSLLRSMFAVYECLLRMNVEFVVTDNYCIHMLCLLRPVLLLCVHNICWVDVTEDVCRESFCGYSVLM